MIENDITLEELADTYGINTDLIGTIFEELRDNGSVTSTKPNILTSLKRPKDYPQKMKDTKFTDTKIGLRLSSIFRHHIYKDFIDTLQNTKKNSELLQLQKTVYRFYDSLADKYRNDPIQLFQKLREKLCEHWNIIPREIREETDKNRKRAMLDRDTRTKHALVLVDIIILFGFLECPLFTDIIAGGG